MHRRRKTKNSPAGPEPDPQADHSSSKNGFAYIIDRETGKFVRGFPYVDAVTWAKALHKNGKPIEPVMPEAGKIDKKYFFCPGTAGRPQPESLRL